MVIIDPTIVCVLSFGVLKLYAASYLSSIRSLVWEAGCQGLLIITKGKWEKFDVSNHIYRVYEDHVTDISYENILRIDLEWSCRRSSTVWRPLHALDMATRIHLLKGVSWIPQALRRG